MTEEGGSNGSIIFWGIIVAVVAAVAVLLVDLSMHLNLVADNNEHAKEYGRLPGVQDALRPIEIIPEKIRELRLTMEVKTIRDGVLRDVLEVVPQRVKCVEGTVILAAEAATQANVFADSFIRIYDRGSDGYFRLDPGHNPRLKDAGFTTSGFDVGAVDGVPDVLMVNRAEPIHVSLGYMADSPCVIGGLDTETNGEVRERMVFATETNGEVRERMVFATEGVPPWWLIQAAERECVAAVAAAAGGPNELAAGVDACLGIEPQTALDCMHDAAKSYGEHGDPKILYRDVKGCP